MITLIFTLVGCIILFYCLTSKETKKIAFYSSILLFIIMLCGHKTPEHYHNDNNFSKEYKMSLAGRGKTLAGVGIELSSETLLEKGGDFLAVTLSLTLVLGAMVIAEIKDKKYKKQITIKCFAFFAVVAMYFLSLYLGVQLLLPWIKSRQNIKLRRQNLKAKPA